MNFFTKLSESGITDVIIQFEQNENGDVTLFVAPKTISRKNLLKTINPIRFVGKSEEIDFDFFQKLNEHLVDVPQVPDTEPSKEIPVQDKEPVSTTQEDAPKRTAPKMVKAKVEEMKAKAEPKVDNIAPLKTFYETIKKDDILPFRVQLEELLAKLSDAEKQKPYPKKVLNDLEIRIRKEENKIAALKKLGFIKEEPVAEAVVEELKGEDEPATEEIAIASPITVEEIEVVEEILEDVVPVIPIATPIPSPEPIPTPAPVPPMPTPAPVAPPAIEIKRFRQETVTELKMIVEDFTYEQYNSVGWTDQQLLDNGKAVMESKVIDIEITEEEYMALKASEIPAPAPQRIGYTFPKPFDEPEEENDEE